MTRMISVKSMKLKKKMEDKIQLHFPTVQVHEMWNRHTCDAFISIPKTLPIVIRILNSLAKGSDYHGTYLALWCRGWDGPFIDVQNPTAMAYDSGFTGVNAVATWKKRMRDLERWGLIKTVKAEAQDFRYVLLLNPHIALRNLKEVDATLINADDWSTLVGRMSELSANDFNVEKSHLDLQTIQSMQVSPSQANVFGNIFANTLGSAASIIPSQKTEVVENNVSGG